MVIILKVPPTTEQGSYNVQIHPAANETVAAAALWVYNSARAHDGLPPLRRMPRGTTYTVKMDYIIQGYYPDNQGGGSWEDETAEETRAAARQRLAEYGVNMPQYQHRLITRRAED
jgi:hypothetical protein